MKYSSHLNEPSQATEMNMRSHRYEYGDIAARLNRSRQQAIHFLQSLDDFDEGMTEFSFYTEVVVLHGNDYKGQYMTITVRLEPDCIQFELPPSSVKSKLTQGTTYNSVVHQFHFREDGPLIIAPAMPVKMKDGYVIFIHPPSTMKTIESEVVRCLEPSIPSMGSEPQPHENTPTVTTWNFMDE